MPARLRANPLALAVLVCLHERPMHPYEIAQTLRSRAKHESIRLNYGSLYSVVESLQSRGLVEVLSVMQEGRRPARTIYQITSTGSTEMTDWLGELLSVPVKEFTSLEAALSFLPALAPEDALVALRERRNALEWSVTKGNTEGELAARMGLPRLFSIEGEYQRALVAAELAFVEGLISDMERGDLEGLDLWRGLYDGTADPFQLSRPELPERPQNPQRPESRERTEK